MPVLIDSRSTGSSALRHGLRSATSVERYEDRLSRDWGWAMEEGGRYFEGTSRVHLALVNLTGRLARLGIDYAVVGGLALYRHGYRRFTDDIDLLVTLENLRKIHKALDGLGYTPGFAGSKNLRDSEYGVKIDFLVTGQFPGDGHPKPVAYPEPSSVSEELAGIKYIDLKTLVELKLASGISSTDRMKDLSDVMELIKIANLPLDLCNALNPYVVGKYREIWLGANPPKKRYKLLWSDSWTTAEADTITGMVEGLRSAADQLQMMSDDGITMQKERGPDGDTFYMTTADPEIAKKYDMQDEAEFWESAG